MSGHSKWTQIKRQKGITDGKRAQSFTRLSRAITLAAGEGGGDPAFNPALRVAIDAAKAVNVPGDNIQRAIAKGVGVAGEGLHRAIYETVGFGGVAILIECSTDSPTRTVAEVRSKLSRAGLKLAAENSMLRLFQEQGLITLEVDEDLEATAMRILEFSEVEDIELDPETRRLTVISERANLHKLARSLQSAGYKILDIQRVFGALETVQISADHREELAALEATLGDLDDVEALWTNLA